MDIQRIVVQSASRRSAEGARAAEAEAEYEENVSASPNDEVTLTEWLYD